MLLPDSLYAVILCLMTFVVGCIVIGPLWAHAIRIDGSILQNILVHIMAHKLGPKPSLIPSSPPPPSPGGRIVVTSSHTPGSLFLVGETPVRYTATDAAGNNRTCDLTITVQGTAHRSSYL